MSTGSQRSLAAMLDAVRQLEMLIDDADEVSLEMCEEHFSALKEVDQKVDRLLGFIDLCKMNAASLEARAKELSDMAERWERKLDGLQKYALGLLKAYPDVSWRGTDRAFKLQVNPPSLSCNFVKSKSFSNYVEPEYVEAIPDEYLEEKTVKVLKANVLKDDLKQGKQVDFARLERKEKLAIEPKLALKSRRANEDQRQN